MLVAIVSSFLLAASPTQAAVQVLPRAPVEGDAIEVNATRRKWNPDRIVCKEIVLPGSRLNVKKICRTMLEWASTQREDQQLLIEKQYNGAP